MARGRPAVGQRVDVRLADDVVEKIDARAAEAGTSRAAIIRKAVEGVVGSWPDVPPIVAPLPASADVQAGPHVTEGAPRV